MRFMQGFETEPLPQLHSRCDFGTSCRHVYILREPNNVCCHSVKHRITSTIKEFGLFTIPASRSPRRAPRHAGRRAFELSSPSWFCKRYHTCSTSAATIRVRQPIPSDPPPAMMASISSVSEVVAGWANFVRGRQS